MQTTALDLLAQEVRTRREQLGYSQGDLSSRGGPGVVTVGKIERAEISRPQAATLHALDRALGWRDGSAAACLRGERPTVEQSDATNLRDHTAAVMDAVRRHPGLLPEAKEHLTRQLGLLLRIQSVEPPKTSSESLARELEQQVEQETSSSNRQTECPR